MNDHHERPPFHFQHHTRCRLGVAVLLAAAMLIAAASNGRAEDEAKPDTFRAAAAEVDITPDQPIGISNLRGLSTGIADRMYARVLVIDDGTAPIAIVTADVVGCPISYARALGKAIEEASGIPAGRVMFNCSHSHNVPGVGLPADPEEPSFGRDVLEKITEMTATAVDRLKPARLAVGRERCQIGFNRLMPTPGRVTMTVNPDGPVVPWVDVLAAYGHDGSRIGILFSYAAHPVVIHSSSTLISADFPGRAATHLRRMLGQGERKGGVMMFAQGCGGNINAFPLKGGIDAADRVGLVLAQAVTRVQLRDVAPARIRSASHEVALPFQEPLSVEEAEKLLAQRPGDLRYQRLANLAKAGPSPDMPYPMSAFAIGDQVCILALPHETFCDYQLWADEQSPYGETLVFGYTGGVQGYVAAKQDLDYGLLRAGYGAQMTNSRMPLKPACEAIIHQGISDLWQKLEEK
ncbi:MAG: hypothetical protein DWQ31_01330 [Planctomycetota bacterium]|nr:MAG: hypothetical protein DWQ31_01330 [Planctomycetota bacterium]REJ95907.1 MAG: hypothetical protein DWQ35_05545 [Planctomycetota bacterium]